MALVSKIDSNVVGLRYAEEQTYGVLPGSPVWNKLEPNSYPDFGASITKTKRAPINPDRKVEKGVTTDREATGGLSTDVTQSNLQDILQGFFWADLRTKDELAVAAVDTGDTSDDYEPASGGDGYQAGDLLFAKGFDDAQNNGLKVVTGVPAASSVPVTTALTEASGQSGIISRVGYEFGAGELDVDVSGTWPKITSSGRDLTTLGINVGEIIFVGGDAADEKFANAVNNGFKRVRSISATEMELDKSDSAMVNETSTTETVRLFFGRVLKDEIGTLIKRRTYQLEREMGAPDDAQPTEIQAEYIVGCLPSTAKLNIPNSSKLTADLTFTAKTQETIDGPTALKGGTRPALTKEDAFNTATDFKNVKLAKYVVGDEAPTPLYAVLEELAITIDNETKGLKGVGVLGSFEQVAGDFNVTATATGYWRDHEGTNASLNNDDLTLHAHIVANNKGVSLDIPVVDSGDAKASVEKNEAIMQPLTLQASNGDKINPNISHTVLMVFWDYLPNAADT